MAYAPSTRTKIVGALIGIPFCLWLLPNAPQTSAPAPSPPEEHEILTGRPAVATNAPAIVQTGGTWISNSSELYGVGVCSFGAGYGDHEIVASVMEGSSSKLMLTFHRDTWNIPFNKQINAAVSFDGQPPMSVEGRAGRPYAVDTTLTEAQTQRFLSLFKTRKSMSIKFADPSEPLWSAPLKGSSAALAGVGACTAGWQKLSK